MENHSCLKQKKNLRVTTVILKLLKPSHAQIHLVIVQNKHKQILLKWEICCVNDVNFCQTLLQRMFFSSTV